MKVIWEEFGSCRGELFHNNGEIAFDELESIVKFVEDNVLEDYCYDILDDDDANMIINVIMNDRDSVKKILKNKKGYIILEESTILFGRSKDEARLCLFDALKDGCHINI
jgi:transcriptional/translational regulatory protein YebC/TACO1